LHNWQYLFIIEGALTCALALMAWIWMPMGPGSAWFLSQEEREFASKRLQIDGARYVVHTYGKDGLEKSNERLSKRDVVETAKDWKFWYILFFNICASIPGQAFSVFLPLIVKGLGYASITANLVRLSLMLILGSVLTVSDVRTTLCVRRSGSVYVCPKFRSSVGRKKLFGIKMTTNKYYRRERGFHCIAGLIICLIGLIITVAVEDTKGRYAGLCILTFGSYVSAPLTAAWLSGNTPGKSFPNPISVKPLTWAAEPGKRSLVLGMNGFGNLSGVIGAQLFQASYAPRYLVPFYATLGFVGTALIGYLAYRYTLLAVNKWRTRQMVGWTDADREEERLSMKRFGDKKYTFMYGL
jgi:hypothetical protein